MCSRGCSTNTFVIHSLINWVTLFLQTFKTSLHPHHTVLNFWENVHPPPRATCQVSCIWCQVSGVRCQVLRVRCHVSGVTCHFFSSIFFWTTWWGYSVEGLLSTGPTPSSLQSDEASRWRVCYQRGLPRLVYWQIYLFGNIFVYIESVYVDVNVNRGCLPINLFPNSGYPWRS